MEGDLLCWQDYLWWWWRQRTWM